MPNSWVPAPVPPPPPVARRRTGLRVGLIIGTLVLMGGGGIAFYSVWHTNAMADFDAAISESDDVKRDVKAANNNVDLIVEQAADRKQDADTLADLSLDGLVDPHARDELSASATILSEAIDEVPSSLKVPSVDKTPPSWPWEIEQAATQIAEDSEITRSRIDKFESSVDGLDENIDDLNDSAVTLFASIETYAGDIFTENIAAKNLDKIAFRDATALAAAQTELSESSVDAVGDYLSAMQTLIESQNIEMAEKAGPLLDSRLAVEEFARQLAPGLLLEFDWVAKANDLGGENSVSATTQWWMDPGRATITLSHSAASWWGGTNDAIVRAVVVHEIGHAITIRCGDMYDWSSQPSIEQWATAWAIAQGYHGEGNGVSLYGMPPQSMIDTAKTCR